MLECNRIAQSMRTVKRFFFSKNAYFSDKMNSDGWRDELDKLLIGIEPVTSTALSKVKETFGLEFNTCFKEQLVAVFIEW